MVYSLPFLQLYVFSTVLIVCGVWVFQRRAVGKVSCQKQACPQLIRQSRDWIWLIKHLPCRHGVCSAAEKNLKQERKKPRVKLEHAPHTLACPRSRPARNAGTRYASPSLVASCAMGVYAYTPRLCALTAVFIPGWDMYSFLCVRTCMCKYSRADALKLRGGDAFHSCPHKCTVRCTRMLILPYFTHMHAQTPKVGFVCFFLFCKSPHTNACFISCCNKGHISSVCIYIVCSLYLPFHSDVLCNCTAYTCMYTSTALVITHELAPVYT